jgi:hypothetical protein
MSLELDGGKHVLAMTGEITKLVSRLASSGLPLFLVARGRGRTGARAGEYELLE